ncbi:MAG: PorT family protein [Thermoflexibacter sp.]|nr:PorT family protein [Thermoflexibacter sp.]
MNRQKHIIFIFFIALFLFCFSTISAQDTDSKRALLNTKYRTIAQNLEKLYQNGELEEVINIFRKVCLIREDDWAEETKEFRKVKNEFRADIYSVICRTYIALDRPKQADRFLGKLFAIRVDENFQEYWLAIRESKSYDYYIAPRLQIGGVAGSNIAFPLPTDRFSVFGATANSTNTYDKTYYNAFNNQRLVGLKAGFSITYSLTKNIGLLTQPSFSSFRFGYSDFYSWADNPAPNVSLLLDLEKYNTQTITYIEFPFLARYQFLIDKRVKPYVLGGVFYNFLSNASKTLDIQELPGIRINQVKTDFLGNFSSVTYDITDLLNNYFYGFMVGTGLAYHYDDFRFTISANYRYGFNNIVNPSQRYANQDLVFGYHDVLDNIRMNSFNLQIGVSYVLTHKAFKR